MMQIESTYFKEKACNKPKSGKSVRRKTKIQGEGFFFLPAGALQAIKEIKTYAVAKLVYFFL